MSAPNVVGLDLSITATGICDSYGDCSTEGGKASLGDRRLRVVTEAVEELFTIDDGLCDRIVKADLVVIEDLLTRVMGGGQTTGLVHGAVRLRLMDWGIPYVLVAPASLKKYATGKGNAGKPEMAVALYKRFGLELADDNQVDAYWLRAMGLDALGHPLCEMPAAQRAALEKVAWPA